MCAASAIITWWTVWPLMSMPRICRRRLLGLVGGRGQLHAAGLAAAAGLDLGLDDGTPPPVAPICSAAARASSGVVGDVAGQHRYTVLREEVPRLVLEQVHECPSSSSKGHGKENIRTEPSPARGGPPDTGARHGTNLTAEGTPGAGATSHPWDGGPDSDTQEATDVDSRRTGQLVRMMVAGTFALTLAACGSGSGGSGVPPGDRHPVGPRQQQLHPLHPFQPERPAAFPITVTRKGGIAGFNDTLVLQADGSLQISSRGHESTCRLKPEILKEILRAVGGVPWSRLTPSSGKARYPDDMVLLVGSGASKGPARLDDPGLAPLKQPLSILVVDSSGPNPAHELCDPT